MRPLRACLLLLLLLSGCDSDPIVEDPLLGAWELVSINDRPLPTTTVNSTTTRYEVLSARIVLEATGWSEERHGRITQNGVATLETTRDSGTWEHVGNEILVYDVRGYSLGTASIVGDALSVLRYGPLAGGYFLYRK